MDRRRAPRSLFAAINNYTLMLDNQRSMYTLAKDNVDMIQRLTAYRAPLTGHKGCVNSIQWSDDGSKILSGSDDQRILISDPFQFGSTVLVDYKTSHRSNIFCAKFLPCNNDEKIISCAGDGDIMYTDLNASVEDNSHNCFRCHSATTYSILTVKDEPCTFYSCGEDGTVRFYDLRAKQNCNCASNQHSDDIIISQRRAVTSLSLNPRCPYELAIGVPDSVSIYDRRKLDSGSSRATSELKNGNIVKQLKVPALQSSNRSHRVTSVAYSSDGLHILASFSSDNIYLFSNMDCETEMTLEVPTVVKETNSRRGKKLRLRGDWSDTGPNARPTNSDIGQQRPTLQSSLMERMTQFLSQMLNEASNETQAVPNESERTEASSLPASSQESLATSPRDDESSEANASDSERQSNSANDPYYGGGLETTLRLRANRAPTELSQSLLANLERQEDKLPPNEENIPCGKIMMKYTGHRNARTMIKESSFWGENFVISGSDCGHVFFWDRNTGKIVYVIEADSHVVNCVKPHPFFPVLAASGIDYTVKLFAPMSENSLFDPTNVEVLVNRNKVMLEETRDTVTVPAAFMIRMLTSFNQIRRSSAPGGPASQQSQSSPPSSSS